MTQVCLKGAKAICAAIGENPKEIMALVLEEGLPAWKRGGTGGWRALPDDLREWARGQRDINRARMFGENGGAAISRSRAGRRCGDESAMHR